MDKEPPQDERDRVTYVLGVLAVAALLISFAIVGLALSLG